MFVRKRNRKLKDGTIKIDYQAVESFRSGGKVKQRVIALGECEDPKEALKQELVYLKKAKKDLELPLSEYKEMREKKDWGLVLVSLPLKQAEKKRAKIQKEFNKHLDKIAKLDRISSKITRIPLHFSKS